MYWKIIKDSNTHQKLVETFAEIKKCDQTARDLMLEVGAVRLYRNGWNIAGGAVAFVFESDPPSGWKSVEAGWMPRRNLKSNKELLAKIDALPTVDKFEWAAIFSCDGFHSPGCFLRNDTFYIESEKIKPREGFPFEDFQEILMSEWALAKEAKD